VNESLHDDGRSMEDKGIKDYHSRKNLGDFLKADSPTDEYFSIYPSLDSEELRIVNHPPENERIFAADKPIVIHPFAKDANGNDWIIKNSSKDVIASGLSKTELEDPTIGGVKAKFNEFLAPVAYHLGRKLGLGVVDQRVVRINGIYHNVSRFLANCVDPRGNEEELPSSLIEKAKESVSAFWPFNYLIGNKFDLQYMITNKGEIMMMDYGVDLLGENCRESFDPLNSGGLQRYRFSHYDIGEHERLVSVRTKKLKEPINLELLEEMVERIHNLSDRDLQEVSNLVQDSVYVGIENVTRRHRHYSGRTKRCEPDQQSGLREEVYRVLLRRRDKIKGVFADPIRFYNGGVDLSLALRGFKEIKGVFHLGRKRPGQNIIVNDVKYDVEQHEVVSDDFVSGSHCAFIPDYEQGHLGVVDLGSTNGTKFWQDGTLLEPKIIQKLPLSGSIVFGDYKRYCFESYNGKFYVSSWSDLASAAKNEF
jgi:hypothetical protein